MHAWSVWDSCIHVGLEFIREGRKYKCCILEVRLVLVLCMSAD